MQIRYIIIVKEIQHLGQGLTRITNHSGEEIEIYTTVQSNLATGTVPNDAKQHWVTSKGHYCSFKTGTPPSLWDAWRPKTS